MLPKVSSKIIPSNFIQQRQKSNFTLCKITNLSEIVHYFLHLISEITKKNNKKNLQEYWAGKKVEACKFRKQQEITKKLARNDLNKLHESLIKIEVLFKFFNEFRQKIWNKSITQGTPLQRYLHWFQVSESYHGIRKSRTFKVAH